MFSFAILLLGFLKRFQYFNRDNINIYLLSVNYICSVNLLIKGMSTRSVCFEFPLWFTV